MNYKDYFKEALVESLFTEDIQTPEREEELDAEIARSSGKRKKDLMRRSIKEKESSRLYADGGWKASPFSSSNPGTRDSLGGARYDSVRSERQARDAAALRKELGMKQLGSKRVVNRTDSSERSKDDEWRIAPASPAVIASDKRLRALNRGFDMKQEQEQEANLGNKASLGKRIGRAIGRMTGSIRVPSDYDDEVEARTEKGRKKTELRDRY